MVIKTNEQSEVRVFQRPLIESPEQDLAVAGTLSYTLYHYKVAVQNIYYRNTAIFFLYTAFVLIKKNSSYHESRKAA